MSTVRMSDYLRRDIVNKFEASHEKSKPNLELDTTRGDTIYNRYIGPNVEQAKEGLRNNLGDILDTNQMFGKANTLKCSVPLNVTNAVWANMIDGTYQSVTNLEEEYRFTIPLSSERIVPMGIDQGSYNTYAREVVFNFDRHEDTDLNYLCECAEYNYKIEAQRKVASSKVNQLLMKFTTLNQALKAWPALSKLVDPEKLAKVHEKQERKRMQNIQKEMADKVVVDNDLNKTILSASLVGDSDE